MMVKLLSPAKINLSLQVLYKRLDGFHEIDTEMQTISLADVITFSPAHQDQFTCSDKTLPTDEKNLVIQAKNLFRRVTGVVTPVVIHLEKNIPHAAGLGGGSSNAATTLFGLNKLFNQPLTDVELQKVSAEIGSDVPFFFSTGSARATGRGEKISAIERPNFEKVTIVKPPFGSSTPAVYKMWQPTSEVADNGLEKPAFLVSPELLLLKKKLLTAGFRRVTLSGSGSSFYCLGEGIVPSLADHQIFHCAVISRATDWYKLT